MSSKPLKNTPKVLIAGAGPVGLTAAHELARRGVSVRIIDRAEAPAVTSRAMALHARTLEICEQMGMIEDFLPRGQRVEHFSIYQRGRKLIRFDTEYSQLPTRYPYTLMVDQVTTEELLRKNLREQGVEAEWGVGLESIEPSSSSVLCRLRNTDGEIEELTVPWLIGADGGRSTVRDQLGLPLLGDTSEQWLVADAEIDGDLPTNSNHLMQVGNGSILAVPFPTPGLWRLVDTADTDQSEDLRLVGERFARKMSHALGRQMKVSTPSWVSVFTIRQRMVPQMRVGRCFVAGDAAHVHSPASGQGMNTGMQDAYNLAWKLADVIRGFATDSLLDTYGDERVPVGAELLRTTKLATTLVALKEAAAPVMMPIGLGFLRNVKPVKRRVERKLMSAMSGLALEYGDSPLSDSSGSTKAEPGSRVGWSVESAERSPAWHSLGIELRDPRWTFLVADAQPACADLIERFGEAVSVRTLVTNGASARNPLADPDSAIRTTLGLRSGQFALIRPDGYLAGAGEMNDAETLLGRFLIPVCGTNERHRDAAPALLET